MKKAAFFTLGCKVNFYDTESMKDLFEKEGFEITAFNDAADVYVINTCTVTHLSDRKSRQLIRQAKKRAPESLIIVTGCYAQVFPDELKAMPEIDLIVGTRERKELIQMIKELNTEKPTIRVSSFDKNDTFERLTFSANRSRKRAFLKVQEGCEQNCSYCIVPLARGSSRSAPLKDILKEVDDIAASGYREIVLTGIRLGLYEDTEEGVSLGGLIKEIEKNDTIKRIRLSSLEPSDLTGELIDAIASSTKVCHHLHIPLQSGSDQILKAMKRPYNTEEFAFVVNVLREQIPNIAIGTDIITGFPGESFNNHRQTVKFIEKIFFSHMHIFRFSPRPGTAANDMPRQVAPAFKEKRWKEIDEVSKKMSYEFRQNFLNTRVRILVEKADSAEKSIEGFTEQYIKVKATSENDPRELTGKIALVDITSADTESDLLYGFLIP